MTLRDSKVRLNCRPADSSRSRQGAITVLSAFLIVILLGMIAFAVDLGFIVSTRTELQRAADAGSLAGAGMLVNGAETASVTVLEFVAANPVAGTAVTAEDTEIEPGTWDLSAKTFSPGGDTPNAIRVRVHRQAQGLFFGPLLGQDAFSAEAESVATYRPRDIMLVLDYSGSMNDDSELKQIGRIGQPAVEANLLEIYNELGAPSFGAMQWQPAATTATSTTDVRAELGLDAVPYPYPSGSWDDYISYVQTDGGISAAGYQNKYGYLTWVNYLLQKQPMSSQTPDLWKTSEQPITAVKDAVTVFLSHMQAVDTNDRLGLSVYTAADGTAVLETGLTLDYQSVEDISRARQAGHYDRMTNIGAGMQSARLEIEDNARLGALKLMILMTDGVANRPTDAATAQAFSLSEAQLAADAKIPIVTISLGTGADTALMQQIADVTGGVHFNIPGGSSVADYEVDLKDVFRKIAEDRALKLVR